MERNSQFARLMNRSMESLETPFSKVVFLASLRDPYAGKYLHEGWATVASAGDVHETMRGAHVAAFREVLRYPLWETCLQLQAHFRSLQQGTGEAARLWLEGEPFRELIPGDIGVVERMFFIAQMRSALAALARCPDLFRPLERDASLLPQPGQPPPLHLET